MDKIEEGLRLMKLGLDELGNAKVDAEIRLGIAEARLRYLEGCVSKIMRPQELSLQETSAMRPATALYTPDQSTQAPTEGSEDSSMDSPVRLMPDWTPSRYAPPPKGRTPQRCGPHCEFCAMRKRQ